MSKTLIIGALLIGAVVAAFAVAATTTFELPVARLTLHAIDEEGKPVPGAAVKMGFEKATPTWGGGDVVLVKGLTDQNGNFTGEGHSNDTAGGQIQKAGYYMSSPESYKFKEPVLGKWQPWNPTLDAVMKKIVNPIPMYARRLQVEIPQAEGPVGFDLEQGDWVAPYGKGSTSDFMFALKRQFTDHNNYQALVTVTFPNQGDGLLSIEPKNTSSNSELKLPRIAPENGYEPNLKTSIGAETGTPGHEDAQASRSYFFRVRTVLDGNGKMQSALYGKIDSDFLLDPINSKTCIVMFTYYLNPTVNDRNVEFDPSKNLFPNLPPDQEVRAP